MAETLIFICAVQAATCPCKLANPRLSPAEPILCRAFAEDNEELESFHSGTWDHYSLSRGFLDSCQRDSVTFFYSIQTENNLRFQRTPAEVFQHMPPAFVALNWRLRCWNVCYSPEQKPSNTVKAWKPELQLFLCLVLVKQQYVKWLGVGLGSMEEEKDIHRVERLLERTGLICNRVVWVPLHKLFLKSLLLPFSFFNKLFFQWEY